MAYVCLGCGEAFEQPVRVTEASGERRLCSPCCLESFAPGVRCEGCGAFLPQGQERHGLCPDCAGDAVERLRDLLRRGFTQAERDVLNDAFDGVDLSGQERGVNTDERA